MKGDIRVSDTVHVDTKEIQNYCHDNKIELYDFVHAAILQTYLRLSGDYFDYFTNDKKVKVIDFIIESINVYETIELPFEINICSNNDSFTVTYKKNKLTNELKNNFLNCIRTVMSDMILKEYVYDVRLLSDSEEHEIYKASTGKPIYYDEKKTWIDMFIKNAEMQPDHIAVVDINGSITYKELDNLSNIIAYYLLENGIQINDFVAIKSERRKEYIIALMGINKAGAAFIPIDAEYPDTLCDYIMQNSEAKIVLTDLKIKEILSQYHEHKVGNINRSNPDGLIYMIYTSGTTGNPKGVMIRHKSITHFSTWIIPYLGLDNTKRNLLHTTFSFDASIMDTLFPLIAGGVIYIVDEKTRMNLRLMAQYIEDNKITGFSLSYAFGREFLSRFDIQVDYVLLGGEAFLPFKKVPFRLINAYGPTEFTIIATVHDVNQDKDYVPPIGRPIPGTIALVLDCFMKPVPVNTPGELYLCGLQIAAGYCNNRTATERNFISFDNGLEFYKTGDLVKYNNENELIFLGRIDRQVKLRGFRIEPAQIENKVMQFQQVLECVVAVKKIHGTKKLCLYYVAADKISKQELKSYLSRELAEYMVPEVYIQMDQVPKTKNGKTDFNKLPEIQSNNNESDYIAPKSNLENRFCNTICKILDLDKIGLNDDFFEFGGDSLKCMELIQELDLPLLDISDIYNGRCINKIITNYKKKIGKVGTELQIANMKVSEYPLLGAQVHFYNIQNSFASNTSCNLHGLFLMNKEIYADRLICAINKVIKAHHAFGNRFYLRDGMVYQKFDSLYIKDIKLEKTTELELQNNLSNLVKPYDIFSEPLYRIRIFQTEKDNVYLFTEFHHLIFDGYSFNIFWSKLSEAYHGKELKEDQYYRFLYNQRLAAEFSMGEKPVINENCIMPFDYQEANCVKTEDREHAFQSVLPLKNDKLKELCSRYNVSPNALFMGCYLLTMYKQTNKKRLCVSWIYNGRDLSFTEDCIGLIINLKFVNYQIDEEQSINQFLKDVKMNINQSLSDSFYNGYALRDLLEDPICCFQYQEMMQDDSNELFKERIELPNPLFKPAFFWEFEVKNDGSDISATCLFNYEYYKKSTALNFLKEFENIIVKFSDGIGWVKDVFNK